MPWFAAVQTFHGQITRNNLKFDWRPMNRRWNRNLSKISKYLFFSGNSSVPDRRSNCRKYHWLGCRKLLGGRCNRVRERRRRPSRLQPSRSSQARALCSTCKHDPVRQAVLPHLTPIVHHICKKLWNASSRIYQNMFHESNARRQALYEIYAMRTPPNVCKKKFHLELAFDFSCDRIHALSSIQFCA